MDINELGRKLQNLVIKKKSIDEIADNLAKVYMHSDFMGSIVIKRYGNLNKGSWREILKIMQERSSQGKTYRMYRSQNKWVRGYFLFIPVNFDTNVIEVIVEPPKGDMDEYFKQMHRREKVFYETFFESLVYTIENIKGSFKDSKLEGFLREYKNKEIFNINWHDEITHWGIYQDIPKPKTPMIKPSHNLDANINLLWWLYFNKTKFNTRFLLNIDLDDKLYLKKNTLDVKKDPNDLEDKKLLDTFYFTAYMINQLYSVGGPSHFSLITPGWAIDVIQDAFSHPNWFKRIVVNQNTLRKYIPTTIDLK